MSLNETNLWTVVKRQYQFKFKAYAGLLFALVLLQLLGILASLGGTGLTSTTASNDLTVTFSQLSANLVIGLTLIWAFASAIYCTTKPYKDLDFTFVSNRLSSGLSNIGFLLTTAVIGGLTATASGALLRILIFWSMGSQSLGLTYFFIPLQDFLLGGLTTTLYTILSAAAGYFVGTLVQANKSLVVFLPLALILSLRLDVIRNSIVNPITSESSVWWFTLRVLICSVIMFGSSLLAANKLEVRQ